MVLSVFLTLLFKYSTNHVWQWRKIINWIKYGAYSSGLPFISFLCSQSNAHYIVYIGPFLFTMDIVCDHTDKKILIVTVYIVL